MPRRRSRGRITAINDSTEFLELMHDFLGEDLGYQFTGLTAVDTTITQVLDTRPDLLMLDLVLEDKPQALSGWELLVLARGHRDLRHCPVIVVSGDVQGILKTRADELASMANVHVMIKPFALDELEPLVRRLLTP
jgi:DNA-binding response OmpR family regulator